MRSEKMSHYKVWIPILTGIMLLFFYHPMIASPEVLMYWLDTSGSMAKHGFEDAKKVLINEVENTKQGDVLIVGTFDSNEYIIGRLAVGEDNSIEAKQELITPIPDRFW